MNKPEERVTLLTFFLAQAIEHDLTLEQRISLQCFASMMRLIKSPGKILTIIIEDLAKEINGFLLTRDDFKQILLSMIDWSKSDEAKQMNIPIRILRSNQGNWIVTMVPGPIFTESWSASIEKIVDIDFGEPLIIVAQNKYFNNSYSKVIDFNAKSTPE